MSRGVAVTNTESCGDCQCCVTIGGTRFRYHYIWVFLAHSSNEILAQEILPSYDRFVTTCPQSLNYCPYKLSISAC